MPATLSWTERPGSVPIAYVRGGGPHKGKVLYIQPADAAHAHQAAAAGGKAMRGGGLADYIAGAAPADTDLADVKLPHPGYFDALPSPEPNKRAIIMVSGPSGAGKSHWALQYAQNYRRLWPERPIVLISALKHDDTLDQIQPVRLDPGKFVTSGLPDIKSFTNALVIIDDIEGLESEQLQAVYKLQDQLCSMGRHTNTSLLKLQHVSTDYSRTRLLLAEASAFVVFPGASSANMVYLLKQYAGLSKEQIAAIRHAPSRWAMVHKNAPQFILTATSCSVL